MLAGTVQTHCAGQLDILPEILIAERSIPATGEVSLIENTAQVKRSAIQFQASILHADLPQRQIGLHLIDLASGTVGQPKRHIIKMRRLRRPQITVLDHQI